MAQLNVTPPNLPLAPEAYQRYYQDQLNNVLRLFFAQLNNPGDMGGTTLNLNIETRSVDPSPIFKLKSSKERTFLLIFSHKITFYKKF